MTIATNVARQPNSCPTRVPRGTPSAVDTAMPPNTMDIAQPIRSGLTREAATAKATPMKRPCSAPVMTRATSSMPKLTAVTAMTFPSVYAASDNHSIARRPNRMLTALRTGPPMEMPNAYALDERAGGADGDRHVGGDVVQNTDDDKLGGADDERAQKERSMPDCFET